MIKKEKMVYYLLLVVISLAHAVANFELRHVQLSYKEFTFFFAASILVPTLGILFDTMARLLLLNGEKFAIVIFFAGPVLMVLATVFCSVAFSLPASPVQLHWMSTYLCGLIVLNEQFFSKEGVFQRKECFSI